jgi:phage terminase Nu1 subunit (DNA packaging protein)
MKKNRTEVRIDNLMKKLADKNVSLHDAKTEKEHYAAKRARLKYEMEKGKLIDITKLSGVWEEVAILLQQSLLSIPDRVSNILASTNDPDKCAEVLTTELRVSLENISLGINNIAERVEDAEAQDEDEDEDDSRK